MKGQKSWDPLNYMEWKLRNAIYKKTNLCPDLALKDVDYNNSCGYLAYDLGSWAHAYLADKFGPNVLLDTFYPNNHALGWEGAFALTYGMSSEEFYKEFDEFINWPEVTGKATISESKGRHKLEDQLAILPASLQTTKSGFPTTAPSGLMQRRKRTCSTVFATWRIITHLFLISVGSASSQLRRGSSVQSSSGW